MGFEGMDRSLPGKEDRGGVSNETLLKLIPVSRGTHSPRTTGAPRERQEAMWEWKSNKDGDDGGRDDEVSHRKLPGEGGDPDQILKKY